MIEFEFHSSGIYLSADTTKLSVGLCPYIGYTRCTRFTRD